MALPTFHLDAGFTAAGTTNVFTVGDPTLGQVGNVPIGDGDVWTDISQYVRRWSLKRGASRGDDPTLRFDAGTLSVDLNDGDRRFDPENLAGPYVSAGVTQLTPMIRIRARAVWNGVTYPLFYGYSDDWVPNYDGNSWTVTTLTATDANKLFAATNRDPVTPVGAGDNSGARVIRILTAYGWPSTNWSISGGDTTLQATDLGGNMLSELQLVQDSEQGQFFVNASGKPTFRQRRHILTYARSNTSQATFGDGGFAATAEIPYAEAVQSTPGDTLINSVRATAVGGVEQVVVDAVSEQRYLEQSHQRGDLIMQTDAGALQWANWIKYQYSTPARRFARLEFNTPRPDVEAAHWPALLDREFSDRITVKRRPPGGGAVIQRDCFVRGIEHSSDNAAEWTSAFVLTGADRYSFFVVGDPVYGRVGLNAVAY
jgi:hypothetical protein